MADWLTVLIAGFAVWRVTHLLAREDGPWQLVARLRGALGQSWAGHLMDCFKCLSLWIALPFAFIIDAGWPMNALLWLALSGAAILLEEQITAPLFIEENQNGMLRGSEIDDGAGGL